jgi:hypothetical protein
MELLDTFKVENIGRKGLLTNLNSASNLKLNSGGDSRFSRTKLLLCGLEDTPTNKTQAAPSTRNSMEDN